MASFKHFRVVLTLAMFLPAAGLVAKEHRAALTRPGMTTLTGAGSTFIAPLVDHWIEAYRNAHPDVAIAYHAVGSSEGIDRFLNGSVDFAATDGGTTAEQIARMDRGVRFIPAAIGGVVLAYNVKGVKAGLKLTREVYVDIFLGRIKTWDDPRIKAINPDLPLPREAILPVVRLDGSGTTYAFTNHLAAISQAWKQGPGVGRSVGWPGDAMQARGNDGVAGRIKISEGAIGYVEYGFAQRLGLPMAHLENRAGRFAAPEASRIAKVFETSVDQMPADLRQYIPDPAGEEAYPIVTYSWLVLYGAYPHPYEANGRALKAFVHYCLTQGQADSEALGYVPLPGPVAELAQKALASVE